VNVASRLMEIAKQYRTTIALSGELLARVREAGLRYNGTVFLTMSRSSCTVGRNRCCETLATSICQR
jgi:hypothetical protein